MGPYYHPNGVYFQKQAKGTENGASPFVAIGERGTWIVTRSLKFSYVYVGGAPLTNVMELH